MNIPDFDPLDEQHRWCVYCNADCWPDAEHQEHAADCPSNTGLFPCDEKFLGPHGMRCMDCHEEFRVGDTAAQILVSDPDDGIPVYEMVCVGCKAAHELLSRERP